MDRNSNATQSQANIYVQGKIDDFFNRFKIATLMHRCGIRKHHGHSVRSLTKAIFTLPFVGVTPTPALKSAIYQLCVLLTIRYIYIITIASLSNYNDEILSFIACIWQVK